MCAFQIKGLALHISLTLLLITVFLTFLAAKRFFMPYKPQNLHINKVIVNQLNILKQNYDVRAFREKCVHGHGNWPKKLETL